MKENNEQSILRSGSTATAEDGPKESPPDGRAGRTIRVLKTILQILGLVLDLITMRKKNKK